MRALVVSCGVMLVSICSRQGDLVPIRVACLHRHGLEAQLGHSHARAVWVPGSVVTVAGRQGARSHPRRALSHRCRCHDLGLTKEARRRHYDHTDELSTDHS